MKMINKSLILSVVSLSIGGFVYAVTRPDTHISLFIDKILPIKELQNLFSFMNVDAIKYYVPDFLWAFSFTCAFLTIDQNFKRICFITSICGILWEVMQFTEIVSGTGDFIDVIIYLTAIFIAVLINKKECSDHEKEQN